MTVTKLLKFVVLNALMGVLVYLINREGYLLTAYENDIAYVMWGIVGLFILGMVGVISGSKKLGMWCAESCVMVGFMGTCLGIYFAFSGVNPEQMTSADGLVPIVVQALVGLGAAIWTTLVGAFFNQWLSLNIEFVE